MTAPKFQNSADAILYRYYLAYFSSAYDAGSKKAKAYQDVLTQAVQTANGLEDGPDGEDMVTSAEWQIVVDCMDALIFAGKSQSDIHDASGCVGCEEAQHANLLEPKRFLGVRWRARKGLVALVEEQVKKKTPAPREVTSRITSLDNAQPGDYSEAITLGFGGSAPKTRPARYQCADATTAFNFQKSLAGKSEKEIEYRLEVFEQVAAALQNSPKIKNQDNVLTAAEFGIYRDFFALSKRKQTNKNLKTLIEAAQKEQAKRQQAMSAGHSSNG